MGEPLVHERKVEWSTSRFLNVRQCFSFQMTAGGADVGQHGIRCVRPRAGDSYLQIFAIAEKSIVSQLNALEAEKPVDQRKIVEKGHYIMKTSRTAYNASIMNTEMRTSNTLTLVVGSTCPPQAHVGLVLESFPKRRKTRSSWE